MTQAHIIFSGTVQGVGFRYTVQSYAQDLKLTGWVKNLRDGRVEILVEGEKNLVEKLIQATEKHFEGYIRGKVIDYQSAQGLFTDFHINQ